METIDKMKAYLGCLLLGAIALLLFMMTGCSSSKKLKQSSYKSTDSTSVSNTHKQGISKTDSLAIKTTDQDFKNIIDIIFDDDTSGLEIISSEDPVEKANDLAGTYSMGDAAKKIFPNIQTITIDGKQISSTRRMKSLSITMAGTTSTVDLTHLVKKDSGQVDTKQSVSVAKVEKESSKKIERHGASVLIWLGISIVLLVAAFVYKKFFA